MKVGSHDFVRVKEQDYYPFELNSYLSGDLYFWIGKNDWRSKKITLITFGKSLAKDFMKDGYKVVRNEEGRGYAGYQFETNSKVGTYIRSDVLPFKERAEEIRKLGFEVPYSKVHKKLGGLLNLPIKKIPDKSPKEFTFVRVGNYIYSSDKESMFKLSREHGRSISPDEVFNHFADMGYLVKKSFGNVLIRKLPAITGYHSYETVMKFEKDGDDWITYQNGKKLSISNWQDVQIMIHLLRESMKMSFSGMIFEFEEKFEVKREKFELDFGNRFLNKKLKVVVNNGTKYDFLYSLKGHETVTIIRRPKPGPEKEIVTYDVKFDDGSETWVMANEFIMHTDNPMRGRYLELIKEEEKLDDENFEEDPFEAKIDEARIKYSLKDLEAFIGFLKWVKNNIGKKIKFNKEVVSGDTSSWGILIRPGDEFKIKRILKLPNSRLPNKKPDRSWGITVIRAFCRLYAGIELELEGKNDHSGYWTYDGDTDERIPINLETLLRHTENPYQEDFNRFTKSYKLWADRSVVDSVNKFSDMIFERRRRYRDKDPDKPLPVKDRPKAPELVVRDTTGSLASPFANLSAETPNVDISKLSPAQLTQLQRHSHDLAAIAGEVDIDTPAAQAIGYEPIQPTQTNLPAVIHNDMVRTGGRMSPKWHMVSSLPGYAQTGIRAMGKQVFKAFTSVPIEKINVLSTLSNSDTEVKGTAGWIIKHGRRDHNAEVKFQQKLPGYEADISVWSVSGYKFIIVRDDFGHYIYGFEDPQGRFDPVERKFVKESSLIRPAFESLKESPNPQKKLLDFEKQFYDKYKNKKLKVIDFSGGIQGDYAVMTELSKNVEDQTYDALDSDDDEWFDTHSVYLDGSEWYVKMSNVIMNTDNPFKSRYKNLVKEVLQGGYRESRSSFKQCVIDWAKEKLALDVTEKVDEIIAEGDVGLFKSVVLLEWDADKTAEVFGKKLKKVLATDRSAPTKDPVEFTRSVVPAADPTPHQEYSRWLVQTYANGGIRMWEDAPGRAFEALAKYDKIKRAKKLSGNDRNIMGIKSLEALEDLVDQYIQREESELSPEVKAGTKKIYSDEDMTVLHITNFAAACYYADSTNWCTRHQSNFEFYSKEGNLYVFIPKKPKHKGEKYQLHIKSGQFMDIKDHAVDILDDPRTHGFVARLKKVDRKTFETWLPHIDHDDFYRKANWKFLEKLDTALIDKYGHFVDFDLEHLEALKQKKFELLLTKEFQEFWKEEFKEFNKYDLLFDFDQIKGEFEEWKSKKKPAAKKTTKKKK